LKFTEKEKKRKWIFYIKDPGKNLGLAIRPLARVRTGKGIVRPIPAAWVASGEGEMAREH
jgi:hypothetical protein